MKMNNAYHFHQGWRFHLSGAFPMEQALDILDMDELPTIVSRLDMANTFGDAEDYAKVLLLAPGKPVVDVEISCCDAFSDYTYKIQATRGSLRATLSHIEYKYFVEEDEAPRAITLDPLSDDEGLPCYCGEKLTWHTHEEDIAGSAFDSAVRLYYDNIYAHLTEGAPLIIQPEKIARQIALMEEVHRQNPLPIRY